MLLGYARVSTTDQTCEMQVRELREYAGRRGWSIAGEYVDTGWSGAKASRPELDRLMQDAALRRFDAVLVWKIDRWGRSLTHLVNSLADLDAYEPQQTFDALVGRFVLAYLKEPSAALRRLAKSVRPGGIVAMVEFDVRVMCVSPHSPLHQQVIDWIVGAFEGSGVNPSLGSDIAKVFHDAGLPWPSVRSVQYAAAGPDGPLWYYGDLLRTLMPNVERRGLASTDTVEIESLADRLSAEAEAKKTTAFLPRWVCAWARVS